MLFAAALVVAVSVPASLFVGNASAVSAPAVVQVAGQSIVVAEDAILPTSPRDTFTVLSYAEVLRQKYAASGGSFSATLGAIRWPFPYTVPITDRFGMRPSDVSGTSHHNGVDFVPGAGTPIYAIADGIVSQHSDDAFGYGNHVIIQHDFPDQNIESLYAHMQIASSPLNAGDVIRVGDFIGLVGDTGNSYGAHLHLEIHLDRIPIDPFAWLQANAV